ncbi:hypothetical protein JL722_858 [Aureococcus anophagefferens]|nr:hypothetical protein JL722_858 [Aureococcus anophagefferens]
MAFSNMEAALDAPLLRVDDASISASSVSTQKRDASAGAGVFALLIALTVGDIVLGAILFDRFGEIYAQYLNLATAACYCVASTAAVLWRRAPRAPRLLVVIGVLNGGGNFFQAVGQPHTPGITQSLLSATLSVPLVLSLSLLFLGKRPSRTAAGAAALVVAGAACSAFRSRLGASRALIDAGGEDDGGAGGIVVEWYAVALFAVAQLIFSAERVFEESVFARALEGLDATTMFCWTMWVQFVLYLPLLPSQQLPALGGLTPPQILPWSATACGARSAAPRPRRRVGSPGCDLVNTALFFAYVAVDGCCYCCGLYVIKRYGASAMVVAGSVALPLQQVVFCAPFLVGRRYAESLYGADVAALVLVLAGFVGFHRLSPEARCAGGCGRCGGGGARAVIDELCSLSYDALDGARGAARRRRAADLAAFFAPHDDADEFDEAWAKRASLRLECNVFTLWTVDYERRSVGLFPVARLLNHACAPNCVREQDGDDLRFTALADIPAGGALNFSYVPAAYGRAAAPRGLHAKPTGR